MNILFICDEYPPCKHGGIGTVVKQLSTTLASKGHKIVVAGFYPYFRKAKQFEVIDNVTVYRYYYGNPISLRISKDKWLGRFFNIAPAFNRYIASLEKLIEKENIEIVEIPDFHEVYRYSGPKYISFPTLSIPIVVKLHGTSTFFRRLANSKLSQTLLEKEKQLLFNASRVISVSEYVAKNTAEIYDYKVPIGVVFNGFKKIPVARINSQIDVLKVIYAGKIAEKKGIFQLIKSWSQVNEKLPQASLYIFGGGSVKELNHLNHLIKKKNLLNIYIKGFISNDLLLKQYQTASCAIFPSFAESFGMTPIEAMSMGCPTIFTERTSGPEIIHHSVDGLLVNPEDPNAIAEAIIFMLSNPKQAIEMGKKGKEKVHKLFNIDVIAENHVKIYKETIEEFSKNKINNGI